MQKRKISSHSKKLMGITSIELILTIFIISILSGIIAINTSSVDKRREFNEAKKIEKTVNYARNLAIATRKRTGVLFKDNELTIYSEKNTSFKNTFEVIDSFELKYLSPSEKSNNFDFIFTSNGLPAFKESNSSTSSGSSISGSGTMYLDGKYKDYILKVQPISGKVTLKENENKK